MTMPTDAASEIEAARGDTTTQERVGRLKEAATSAHVGEAPSMDRIGGMSLPTSRHAKMEGKGTKTASVPRMTCALQGGRVMGLGDRTLVGERTISLGEALPVVLSCEHS